MSARFRLLHFETQPVGGIRVPFGAVVDCDGHVEVVRATRLPDAASLGSPAIAQALEHNVALLQMITRFDEIPPSFGPQAHWGAPRPMPTGIRDPAAWVARHVLP